MEQIKNNWIDYFYTLNLLLLKSKNEAQFNKKVKKLEFFLKLKFKNSIRLYIIY